MIERLFRSRVAREQDVRVFAHVRATSHRLAFSEITNDLNAFNAEMATKLHAPVYGVVGECSPTSSETD